MVKSALSVTQADLVEPVIVTTSWDDGYPKDLKIAELLCSKELGGTFYIPIQNDGHRKVLDATAIRDLARQGFEIGAHGYSHRALPELSPAALRDDIWMCVHVLEDIIGDHIRMFCYPKGRYDASVIRTVKQAGLQGGRTTRMLYTSLDFDSFEMPVTLQAYPHSPMTYFRNLVAGQNARGLWSHLPRVYASDNWVGLGKWLFDVVLREGGIWHLYGHSWEIEGMGLWRGLEELLDYVSGRPGVRYLCNHELLDIQAGQAQRELPDRSVRI
jgi:peptidoglycan-N-acetylglucosamine deacetylase